MIQSEYAENYAVKISYNSFDGSGVLVKTDNNCYLFTAKHNFKKNKRDTHDKIIVKGIALDAIQVKRKDKQQITVKRIVYHYHDLIVFIVEIDTKRFDTVRVLKTKPTDKMGYFFYGYPAHKPNGHFINNLGSRYQDSDNIFTFRNFNDNKMNYMKSFSGSGVFVEDENGVYYLCGIVLNVEDSYYTINCFDLSSIITHINSKLISRNLNPIKIQESSFNIREIDEMYSWITDYHSDNFLVQTLKGAFGEEHIYKDLIHPSSNLKKINNYMYMTNEFYRIENKYSQKIADMYLLGAFTASRYQDKERALFYLEKARFFRPEYIIFLAEIDKENSKEELFQAGKIAYIEDNYFLSSNCFQKILSLKIERFEMIIAYEYLTKMTKNIDKLIAYYYELVKLYNNNAQKAKVYYELSFIEISKKEENISKGIQLISHYYEFLELQYLLWKRRYEFEQTKENYRTVKTILEELVRTQPKYEYELSTLEYGETLTKIGWASYISILIVILLSISMGNIYSFWSVSYPIIFIPILSFSIMVQLVYKIENSLFIFNTFVLSGSVIYLSINYFFD